MYANVQIRAKWTVRDMVNVIAMNANVIQLRLVKIRAILELYFCYIQIIVELCRVTIELYSNFKSLIFPLVPNKKYLKNRQIIVYFHFSYNI